jgi:hypothetical protein
MGSLAITIDRDNPWDAGQLITVNADLKATGQANEWEIAVNYDVNTSTGVANNVDVKALGSADQRTNTISIVPSSVDSPGKLTLTMARGSDPDENEATETWELVIFDHPVTGADEDTSVNIVTNPSVAAVYRWLTEETTSIDVEDFFDNVSGNQAVIIK